MFRILFAFVAFLGLALAASQADAAPRRASVRVNAFGGVNVRSGGVNVRVNRFGGVRVRNFNRGRANVNVNVR